MCAPRMRALRTQSEGPARKERPLREQRVAVPEHVGVLRDAVVRFAGASGVSQRSREQIAQMSDRLDIEVRDEQPGVRLRMTFAIA